MKDTYLQFAIGTITSLTILIIFARILPLELLLQLISLIYFSTQFVETNANINLRNFLYLFS